MRNMLHLVPHLVISHVRNASLIVAKVVMLCWCFVHSNRIQWSLVHEFVRRPIRSLTVDGCENNKTSFINYSSRYNAIAKWCSDGTHVFQFQALEQHYWNNYVKNKVSLSLGRISAVIGFFFLRGGGEGLGDNICAHTVCELRWLLLVLRMSGQLKLHLICLWKMKFIHFLGKNEQVKIINYFGPILEILVWQSYAG